MSSRNDLDLYERRAAEWGDPRSRTFRSLRSVKRHHLSLLRGLLADERVALAVDLGCGGGLLTAPLAALAGRAVGVDLSGASLAAARRAAAETDAGACSFVRADVRRLPLVGESADLVVLSDVLEHVERPAEALREAARVLRPGGWLFANTLNATRRSRLLAVTLAEGLGLIPRGTHDPRLFIAPERLVADAAAAGLRLVRLEGECPRLLRTLFTWTIHVRSCADTAVGYNAVFEKGAA